MNYDELKKDDLRALCGERGLPVSGTNEELVARLRGWDAEHGDEGEDPDLLALADQPDRQPEVAGDADPAREESGPSRPHQHRVQFRLADPGALTDEEHLLFIQQTQEAAAAEGLTIRGGAYRVGDFQHRDGGVYVTYEVLVR